MSIRCSSRRSTEFGRSAPDGYFGGAHDSQPPNSANSIPRWTTRNVTTETTDVAGNCQSDMLSGFDGLDVTVNGIAAEVDIGIGTNGTFFTPSVPFSARLKRNHSRPQPTRSETPATQVDNGKPC